MSIQFNLIIFLNIKLKLISNIRIAIDDKEKNNNLNKSI